MSSPAAWACRAGPSVAARLPPTTATVELLRNVRREAFCGSLSGACSDISCSPEKRGSIYLWRELSITRKTKCGVTFVLLLRRIRRVLHLLRGRRFDQRPHDAKAKEQGVRIVPDALRDLRVLLLPFLARAAAGARCARPPDRRPTSRHVRCAARPSWRPRADSPPPRRLTWHIRRACIDRRTIRPRCRACHAAPRRSAFSCRPGDMPRCCCRSTRRSHRAFGAVAERIGRLRPARQAYSHSASVGSR